MDASNDCCCGGYTDECTSDFTLRCHCCTLPCKGGELHHAASSGDTEKLASLLASWPAGEALPIDSVGSTPLHSAAAQGQKQAVQLLLAHCGAGAAEELARINEFGLTPFLALALGRAGAGAWETAVVLAAAGVDPHARTQPPQADLEALAGDTALHLAAQHSQPGACMAPLVYYFLMAGLDPLEHAGHLHTSPLEYACAAGGECQAGQLDGRAGRLCSIRSSVAI